MRAPWYTDRRFTLHNPLYTHRELSVILREGKQLRCRKLLKIRNRLICMCQ